MKFMESKVVRGQEMREEMSAYLAIPNFQLFVGQYGEQNFISVANHLDKRSGGMRRSQNFRPAQWEIHRCFLLHRIKRIRLHTVTSIHSPVHSRSKFGYDIPYTLVLHIIIIVFKYNIITDRPRNPNNRIPYQKMCTIAIEYRVDKIENIGVGPK